MQAEIIAIGDEILIGQTIDTNSSFIATQLNLNGISVRQKRVIADDADAIKDALDSIASGTKLVFMTGGLGPTKDDITKKTLLEYFGGEMVFHESIYEHIEQLFASFGRKPSPVNKGQAMLPSSCSPVINKMGTAPGMRFEKDGVFYFSTPGVPYETEHLVEMEIIPWINSNLKKGTVVHKTILTQGVPESELADKLEAFEDKLPEGVKLAYLPSAGMVKLRLTSYHGTEAEARAVVDEQIEEIKTILGSVVFGAEAQTLQEVIGIGLRESGATLSTAESCTGGYIASLITSIPGSSDYFMGSVVSYSNKVKQDLLDVEEQALMNHGAVSKEVVMQMALGAQKKFGTTFSIATSGVAGPGGGSDEKPVGTVWIATATPDGVKAKKFSFGNNRKRNIRKAALMALDLLRREIQKIEV
ncbi:competence/damage-inducible protein A [Owenweeksia hongkongensis]|uniref:competence/damage-inducible protein A n=1 Tax=Owenweeksia hongkongensis TaxID=253245 RepID=UPI003A8DAB0E